MKTKSWILLTATIVFGLFFRLYNFGSNPPSLYWDEVAIGIDAKSITTTNLDQHGNSTLQPLFPSYGDYKAPVYIYLVSLLDKILPWSDALIRLPSLLAYFGISLTLFLIIKKLQPKSSLALIAILSLAIMPWSIHFSKIGFESHLSVFWLSLSLLFLVKSSKKPSFTSYLFASLSLLLGVYSYIVLRVIGPIIFVLAYFSLNFKSFKSTLKPFLISLVTLFLGITYLTHSPYYQASQQYRLSNDNLLSSKHYLTASIQALELNPTSTLNRVLNHRYLYLVTDYLHNYLEYFSFQFLGITGDPNLRHHTGFGGMLLLPQLFLLIIGLFNLKKLTPSLRIISLSIFFLSPSVAALVNETSHASRSIYFILPLSIFIALGWTSLKSKALQLIVGFALLLNLSLYLYDYKQNYPLRSHQAWITPYTKVFKYLNSINSSKEIYITDQLYLPQLYANYYLSSDYSKDNLTFFLPDSCPLDAWCISSPDWQPDTHQVVDIIPGTSDLVVKQSL